MTARLTLLLGSALFSGATTSDTFVGMGGRVPGPLTIEDAVVHLPVRPR